MHGPVGGTGTSGKVPFAVGPSDPRFYQDSRLRDDSAENVRFTSGDGEYTFGGAVQQLPPQAEEDALAAAAEAAARAAALGGKKKPGSRAPPVVPAQPLLQPLPPQPALAEKMRGQPEEPFVPPKARPPPPGADRVAEQEAEEEEVDRVAAALLRTQPKPELQPQPQLQPQLQPQPRPLYDPKLESQRLLDAERVAEAVQAAAARPGLVAAARPGAREGRGGDEELASDVEVFAPAAVAAAGPSAAVHQQPVMAANDNSDLYFIAIVAGCCAAAVVGIIAIGISWYRLQKSAKAAADVEYPAYGVTGPNKEVSPTGDRRLAQSAQMYHYQHQKQQIIAMESRIPAERNGSVSEAESEEENEEGDYTVYECPGLAPTGEMEVKNPLFHDDPTPATPGGPTTTGQGDPGAAAQGAKGAGPAGASAGPGTGRGGGDVVSACGAAIADPPSGLSCTSTATSASRAAPTAPRSAGEARPQRP